MAGKEDEFFFFFFFFRMQGREEEEEEPFFFFKTSQKPIFTSNGSFGSLFRSCTTDSVSCAFFLSSSAFIPRPTTLSAL